MLLPFNPLKYPLCFEKPWRLTDITSWHEHIPFAFFLVQILQPKILIELGTHKGDSYCAFCQAVLLLKLNCAGYAVDTWQGDEHSSFYDEEIFESLRSYHDSLYGSFSRLMKATFDQALPYFSNATVDLLHIDGLHSFEAVKHDFSAWLPKMSEQGVILLHDINVREREFGVWKLWEEIKDQYPSFEFKHGNGLGVLGVGNKLSAEVSAFFDFSKGDRALIANFFSYLGSKITLEDKVRQTNEELSQAKEAIILKKKEIADLSERSEKEKQEINKRYQEETARLEEVIKGLQLEVTHLKLENARISQNLPLIMGRLCDIENSLAWKLITRFRQRRDKILPQGTRRRRFYHLSLKGISIGYKEGLVALGRKIFSAIPFKKKLKGSGKFKTLVRGTWHPLSFPLFKEVEVSIIIPVHNQSHYTLNCLRSIRENTEIPYEVIIVDNASYDNTAKMLAGMGNIRVIHNQENQGFVFACNQGAELGVGKNLLFLNNDTEVTKGWLEAMVAPLKDEKVGIVGAKLIYPDGRLQEAGNIIWQNGSGWNYGWGDDPNLPQYSYLREVDYCSGACFLIRKDLWLKLGGFDRRFAPAYYEDTDLCFAARQLGCKVVYQPEAGVTHFEGVTAGTDIGSGYKRFQQINLGKFREKWLNVLEGEQCAGPEDLYLARERGFKKRVLVVDHYVPTFDMDSGSLRMFSILKILTELGYKVVFWPQNLSFHERYTRELQRIGIEVLYGGLNFDQYLQTYGKYFDVIILSRPNIAINFIYPAKKFTNARVIFDTVDLHFVREERKAILEGKGSEEYQRWKDLELFLSYQADHIMVVSPVEKVILEKEGFKGKVSVITNIHSLTSYPNPFDQREGLMFIGGFVHLPNEDGIVWFVEQVLPLIRQSLPDIKLYIVGSNPTNKVKSLASSDIIVTGYVEDVSPYFEKTRIFVSPLRYGAGLKGKIGQSMAYGLPVVTTSIGAEGFDLIDNEHALIADKEQEFAQKVVKLYQDRSLWETLSSHSRKLIEDNYTPGKVKERMQELLREGKAS